MNKIIGIGETVLDLIFRGDQPSAAVPGGSTFNAMISLGRTAPASRPDVKVMMVTEIGDDMVGDIVTGFMKKNGVTDEAVIRHKGIRTPLSMAFLNDRNDAQYEFYKDHLKPALSEEDGGCVTFSEGDVVVFGSFFAFDPNAREFVYGLLRRAKEAGALIYYDVNFRKNHISNVEEHRKVIEENCRLSDYVRASDEDLAYLYGSGDAGEIYDRHISGLCRNFICTRGGLPVKVFSDEFRGEFEVPQVKTVSTIGAGDNFNAGFVFGLITDNSQESPRRKLDAVAWGRQISIACRFSSAVCESIYNYVDPGFRV